MHSISLTRISRVIAGIVLILLNSEINAVEWKMESFINASAEYHDNIFLKATPDKSVSGIIVGPGIKLSASEKNWETYFSSKITDTNYSDDRLDSTPVNFDLNGKYSSERNIYSLNGSYDLESSIDSDSSDFGISTKRVVRKTYGIAPQYTRMLSEKSTLSLGYTHTDVDYKDEVDTGFVKYITDEVSGILTYRFTKIDKLTMSVKGTDYNSKDNDFEYRLITSSIGMSHNISNTFSFDYEVGYSNRESTSRSTDTFSFFGSTVTRVQSTDYVNNGVLYNVGFDNRWETSTISGRLSRNNTTDTFGGLNETSNVSLEFNKKLTDVLRYSIYAKHEKVESVSLSSSFSDRKSSSIEPKVSYNLGRDLLIFVSYRYLQREFTENNIAGDTPSSNKIAVGMTYNFAPL